MVTKASVWPISGKHSRTVVTLQHCQDRWKSCVCRCAKPFHFHTDFQHCALLIIAVIMPRYKDAIWICLTWLNRKLFHLSCADYRTYLGITHGTERSTWFIFFFPCFTLTAIFISVQFNLICSHFFKHCMYPSKLLIPFTWSSCFLKFHLSVFVNFGDKRRFRRSPQLSN